MTLQIEHVAGLVADTAAEEVIETNLSQGGERCIRRDMPAYIRVVLVRADNHGRCVPADQAFYAPFEQAIPRVGNLLSDADGVQVRSIGLQGGANTGMR